MKMLKHDYDAIKQSAVDYFTFHRTTCAAESAKFSNAGLSAERFRWDLFMALQGVRHSLGLYKYLNDSHIDTALRRIVAELA